jgi:hypothetical protein
VIPPSAFHLLQDPDAVALTGAPVRDVPPVVVTEPRLAARLWALARGRQRARLADDADVAYVTE